jgi:hypothetical protein
MHCYVQPATCQAAMIFSLDEIIAAQAAQSAITMSSGHA